MVKMLSRCCSSCELSAVVLRYDERSVPGLRFVAIVLALCGFACGDEDTAVTTSPGTGGGGEGTAPLAGIPEDACAQGFAPDGAMGCEAILPAEPCPPGQM